VLVILLVLALPHQGLPGIEYTAYSFDCPSGFHSKGRPACGVVVDLVLVEEGPTKMAGKRTS
jgi:hypothetical protein